MTTAEQIALHCEQVFFGGNWTASNLRDQLADVTWKEALVQVYDLNTIAVLTYHIYYYVHAALPVLNGQALNAHDQYSFEHPPLANAGDWQHFQAQIWQEVRTFVAGVQRLSDTQLAQYFYDKKYGSYYRNLLGTIEHSHYHLGQIALIKKIIRQQ
jgi:hypothetical protein